MKDIICHHCERACEVLEDKQMGDVSECCGVGFSYENETGEVVDVNDGLRYLLEWNE